MVFIDFDGVAKLEASPKEEASATEEIARGGFVTLRDVFRFCRSSVPAQRAFYMKILRRIIVRARYVSLLWKAHNIVRNHVIIVDASHILRQYHAGWRHGLEATELFRDKTEANEKDFNGSVFDKVVLFLIDCF